MRRFERRYNTFNAREHTRSIKSGGIRDGGVRGAALIREPRVLRTNCRIVESGGDGMRGGDLSVFVLQNVRECSLQHSGARSGKALMRRKARGVFAKLPAAAAGFDANHFHIGVAQKLMKQADGVRTSANARK